MLLNKWLDKLMAVHPKAMDLGLQRIGQVAKKLSIEHFNCPVITVAGTNGKGSCVSTLEQIYLTANYQTGVFTSPYLKRINEEIRLNGQMISDEKLIQAFETIEKARSNILLTYFEFIALAALLIFKKNDLDVIILEVGLGGRLDAVNIIDADISIITSIDLDHQNWLGNTREKIALEKAGILRKNKIAICGDPNPPETLLNHVKKLKSDFYQIDIDFNYTLKRNLFDFSFIKNKEKKSHQNLPEPNIDIQNAATALVAVKCLENKLPTSEIQLKKALATVFLPGRYQKIPGDITQVFDVAHNPAAVKNLIQKIKHDRPNNNKIIAVFSTLADKDTAGIIHETHNIINEWHIAEIGTPRASSLVQLQESFEKNHIRHFFIHENTTKAYETALKKAEKGDWVVIFGSFYLVGELLPKGEYH